MKIGSVIIMMAICSMKQPRTRHAERIAEDHAERRAVDKITTR